MQPGEMSGEILQNLPVESIMLKVDGMPNCKICGLVYSNHRMGKPEIRRHLFTEHCLQNDILKKVNTFF